MTDVITENALDGRPVHILFSGATQSQTTGSCPEWIQQFLRDWAPNWTRHWAVRVGDTVWDLYLEGGHTVRYRRFEYVDVERYYDAEIFMGITGVSDEEVTRIASELIDIHHTYNAFGDNCQHFAYCLTERIPKTSDIGSQGWGRKIWEAWCRFVGSFMPGTRDGQPPLQARDIKKAAQQLLRALINASVQGCHIYIQPIIDNVMNFFIKSAGSAMAWFAELAAPLMEHGWVLLRNGASFLWDISSRIMTSVNFQGVINVCAQYAPAGIAITIATLGIYSLWNWWNQPGTQSNAQLTSVALRVYGQRADGISSNTRSPVVRVELHELANGVAANAGDVTERRVHRRRRRIVTFE